MSKIIVPSGTDRHVVKFEALKQPAWAEGFEETKNELGALRTYVEIVGEQPYDEIDQYGDQRTATVVLRQCVQISSSLVDTLPAVVYLAADDIIRLTPGQAARLGQLLIDAASLACGDGE
jgi:hypothetical protein